MTVALTVLFSGLQEDQDLNPYSEPVGHKS